MSAPTAAHASSRLAVILLLGAVVLVSGCATHHVGNPAASEPPAWVEENLRVAVEKLAGDIGERSLYRPENLQRASAWIETELRGLGYTITRQAVVVPTNTFRCLVSTADNIEAKLVGSRNPERNIVIGAHYDTKVATPGYLDWWPPVLERAGTPGANDNGSGVAAVLALARSLSAQPCASTIRLVFFANEEPPFFQKPDVMGSYAYAQALKNDGVKVEAMLSLETLGCYSVRPHKKRFRVASLVGLPSAPDYVAFLSNLASWEQSRRWAEAYAKHSRITARTWSVPALSARVGWSDDWAFWKFGFPAFCVTDTAFLRNDDYHETSDTPQQLDYPTFAAVVWGLERAIRHIANE